MKVCVFTLGCKMNEVESASLMKGLEARGFEVTDKLSKADLYLLNTCAVTKEAERKSRQAVARMRKFNPKASVVVFGCAAERGGEEFAEKEGVTLVCGAQGKEKILNRLDETGIFREKDRSFSELPPPGQNRTRAYLRIQDGCDRFCSYCVIPYLRGRSRSRRAESVLKEALASPSKEIVLTGIDVSSYRDGETGLKELIGLLSAVPARIRLGSLEAGVVSKELLAAMKKAGNFCPHFHLSLQSGSDAVLKAMNRRYTRAEFLACCRMIYDTFPDAAITTDIIAGFPTETEENFEESLSIIPEAGFARVHCFPFSPRPGTAAAKLKDLSPSVKRERMSRLTAAAEAAEKEYIAKFFGKERTVLFEEDGGYSENYIRVYAAGAEEGQLCRVRLKGYERDGASAEILEVL